MISLNAFSQHQERSTELIRVIGENKEFCEILDSIISHERQCTYYSDNLLFAIDVKKQETNYFIFIESLQDSNLVLGLSPYGYFYYEDHLVIVSGYYTEELFSKSQDKRKFNYVEYDPDFQEEGSEKIINVFNDDSFSQWQYWYVKNKFIFKGKSTTCD